MPRRTAIASSAPLTASPSATPSSSSNVASKRPAPRQSQSQSLASRSPADGMTEEPAAPNAQIIDSTASILHPKNPVPHSSIHASTPKKKIVRPPKYHETHKFLQKESAVYPRIEAPSHLGHRVGESYRLAATMSRIIEQAAMSVRPISWGYGTKDGTLGHANTEFYVEVMKRVAAFRGDYVRQVSAGDKISLFLTQTGRVLACGRLFLHQDGISMWKPREVSFVPPTTIESAAGTNAISQPVQPNEKYEIRIVSIEAGHLAAYAVDAQGRVYAWGVYRYGQLGLGDEETNSSEEKVRAEQVTDDPDNQDKSETDEADDDDTVVEKPLRRLDPVETVPRRVRSDALDGVRVTKVSAGNHFVLAMSSCGKVFSWGWNGHGQLGLGAAAARDGKVASPQQITAALDALVVVDIAAGHSHALLVAVRATDQGEYRQPVCARYTMVFAFGLGKHGRLGIGGEEDQCEPVEATFFRGLQPASVAAGRDHSLVSCSLGSCNYVYAFGGNAFGQLGIAQTVVPFSDMPMVVDELSGLTIASIGAGAYTSSAVSGDGEVYTWGDGTHGKTARPDHRTTFMPWKIPSEADASLLNECKTEQVSHRVVLEGDGFVTQLVMGAHHSLALYRTVGKPDRWRKFPMCAMAPSLEVGEGSEYVSLSVFCESSAAHGSIEAFGITLHCETCGIGPLCRVCSRRCHCGHRLVPCHVSHTEANAKTLSVVRCACGSRRRPLPAAPQVNRQQTVQHRPTNKTDATSAVQVTHATASTPPSEAPANVYCTMMSIPITISEDALLR